MKAYLFRFYHFHRVLLVFVLLHCILALKHFTTFRAFMVLSSASMTIWLMSFQALVCEHCTTLIAFRVCCTNVGALFMVFDQLLSIGTCLTTVCALFFCVLGVHVHLQVIVGIEYLVTGIAFVS